jgi:PPK2 family polyphosphate:nucleotide phosphotransferase
MLIDSPYLVTPGKKFRIDDYKTDDTGPFKDREEAEGPTQKNLKKLSKLQEVLYAQAKYAVLIVLQSMDAGGKDGTIRHVFSGVNPQGCQVTSFKVPSTLERHHDFLWRHHNAAPPKAMIGIFNRSHYEAVLVERVHKIAPKDVWSKRYDHINAFERLLSDEGTLVLKFFLHISKDEQKERLQDRLDDPAKHWKFDPNDLHEREHWDEYQDAYQDAIGNCSTKWAPWYVVPGDRKWFRNWVISDTISRSMQKLDLEFPPAAEGLEKLKVK